MITKKTDVIDTELDKEMKVLDLESQSINQAYQGEIEDVLEKYSTMIYRLAFSRTKNQYDAEDIMQEVFLRYIRHSPEINDEEHLKAWFIRATINCSKSLFTSAWFRKITPITDDLYTEMDKKSSVYYAVMELPAKYRTVIHLYYYQDYKIAEIAEILQIKQPTIKSQLHRAREMLRKKLGDDLNFD